MRAFHVFAAIGVVSTCAKASTADLDPVARSERSTIVCKDGRQVIAEFSDGRDGVHLVTLRVQSRDLPAADRAIVDREARALGVLDRVTPVCNGDGGQIAIGVTGALVERDERMWQQALIIVWDEDGVRGTGGRPQPAVELIPSPYHLGRDE